ncbi:MAG: aminotransferase class III-fold pyridoxal phosphate-dependent enzyme [Chromatiales bacterium]|nr:aminotransferase class III-fold pyridoxal phosphate-dependent enzyme [Chromatiales bacterium]
MRDDAPNSWESRADAFSLYGFTDLPSVHQRGAVVLTHGKGPYVYDVHGRAYLDANSGLWNMVAGCIHPGLTEAAKAQYDRFPGYHAFFGRMSDQTVMLSENWSRSRPRPRTGVLHQLGLGSERHDGEDAVVPRDRRSAIRSAARSSPG